MLRKKIIIKRIFFVSLFFVYLFNKMAIHEGQDKKENVQILFQNCSICLKAMNRSLDVFITLFKSFFYRWY